MYLTKKPRRNVQFLFFISVVNHAEGSRQVIANYGSLVKSHGQFVDR